MKQFIGVKVAGWVLLLSLLALAVFHVLVLFGAVPPTMVWGGRAPSGTSLVPLEVLALVVIAVFFLLVLLKMDVVRRDGFEPAARFGLWLLFAFLILNTLGNLASRSGAEKLIFVPITLILSLFAYRLAIEE